MSYPRPVTYSPPPRSLPRKQSAAPQPARPLSPMGSAHQHYEPQQVHQPRSFNVNQTVRFDKPDEKKKMENTTQLRRAVFNQDMLTSAWNRFIIENPARRLITSIMSMTVPTLVSENVFSINVDEGQKNIVDQFKQDIINALRNYLQNDFVGMNVNVVAAAPKQTYKTQREIIDEIRAKHPGVEALIQDFNLSLY